MVLRPIDLAAVRAVLFDMDGVIVDTEPIYFASNRALFRQLGFTVTESGYAQFVGLEAEKMWAQLKTEHHLSQPVDELVRMEADGMAAALRAAELHPMPGLPALLGRIRAHGARIGLASSSAHPVIRIILEQLGLQNTFETVVSGDDVEHGKPAPDIFLLAAARLGVEPGNCLVIEDSANGVRAAKAAGMPCVGFRNPGSGGQDLHAADQVVHTLDAVFR